MGSFERQPAIPEWLENCQVVLTEHQKALIMQGLHEFGTAEYDYTITKNRNTLFDLSGDFNLFANGLRYGLGNDLKTLYIDLGPFRIGLI